MMMMFSSSRSRYTQQNSIKTSDIIDDDDDDGDDQNNTIANNRNSTTNNTNNSNNNSAEDYQDDEIKSKRSGCNWSLCCTVICRLLSICNTVAIGLLVVMVFWQYQQIQSLEAMIPLVQNEIKDLEEEVQTKQQSQIQKLNQEL